MPIFHPYFEDDIFISYAHADNLDPRDNQNQGWVDALYEKLKQRLRQLTGVDPSIWRDEENMRKNSDLDEEIPDTLQRVAVLVSILSPSYVTSTWCKKELDAFYQWAVATGKIHINNKSRIFKVVKTPVAKDKHPQEFKNLPGYNFYDKALNGMPREYSHIPGFYGYAEFRRELEVLAWEISTFVELCQPHDLYPRTVYLAETVASLEEERKEIKRELQTHHYHVLPDKPLPEDGAEFEAEVRGYLKRSRLSIHLIGGETGAIPAGYKRDTVQLQHSLAREHQKSSDLFRVVWTPIGLKPRDQAQRKFISRLRTRPEYQIDAELLLGKTKLSNLKTYLLEKMKDLASAEVSRKTTEKPPEKPREDAPDVQAYIEPLIEVVAPPIDEPICVYLICDKRDFKSGAFVPLRDYLLDEKGYNVTLPVMDGKPKEVIAAHERNLAECDVAIIFYGQVNQTWVDRKLDELKKIMANGRTKPRPVNAIYIVEPEDDIKKYYRNTPRYQVVKNLGEFSPEPLEPLLNEIQERFPQNNKSRGMAK